MSMLDSGVGDVDGEELNSAGSVIGDEDEEDDEEEGSRAMWN